ncbi:hypothetical protein Ais01nite_45820 [Asanoa ishikariensis]|uniref:Uncharacterized protein n=1 Tax=Asanoa ishikariensis TaxID=137265 RepID=A0A1H3S3C5_9ACTN|nr:hypothetical protein [Asanoa ishikariensis]GIF66547.1 hypothetical protein Ais01nite_45820 [Asanoa ishikariensis]SDZ32320.1 hypothetical protein SAMN05421684_4499 [Asanoa ishikariensis]
MRSLYIWLSRLIALGVVVQVLVIAWSAFDIQSKANDGVPFTEDTEANIGAMLHSVIGMMVIPVLALLFAIVSFFAKVRGGAALAWGVFGLVVLQIALAFASFAAPVVGTLHALNAFAVAGLAGMAGSRATKPDPSVAAPARSSDPGVPAGA